ncbi:hypothetical protein [Streptomyces sp. MAI_2237]
MIARSRDEPEQFAGLAGLLKLVPVMPEGLRPAAYEALGMVPGVKVVPNQKDARGRVGVAVTYDDPTLPKGSAGFGLLRLRPGHVPVPRLPRHPYVG